MTFLQTRTIRIRIHARIGIDYFFKVFYMTPFRPTSYDRPGEQISTTPSGLKVTSAKRLMVDSMVRMIQKAENHSAEDKLDEESNDN